MCVCVYMCVYVCVCVCVCVCVQNVTGFDHRGLAVVMGVRSKTSPMENQSTTEERL